MITKIIYFRPEKRLLNNEDLMDKYTCLIKDEFTTAESSITVPAYLTVFQHYVPKLCCKSTKLKQAHKKPSTNQRLEKICFYLVGSKQAPRLTETSNVRNIDRIEFKGHIGYEQPVFEIISQLPALRKVSFLINPCKQKAFIADVAVGVNAEEKEDEQLTENLPNNLLVTDIKIAFEKCLIETSKIKENYHQHYERPCLDDDTKTTMENIRMMIVRILKRIVVQCPNIKRLCMDVPNYEGLKKFVEESMKKLCNLKPSVVLSSSSNIKVRKSTDIVELPDEEDSNPSPEVKSAVDDNDGNDDELKAEPEMDSKNDEDEKIDNKSHIGADEPDSTPCLLDMSKLLGSMLGIPTSSLPSGPLLSQLPNTSSAGSSQCGTNNISNNSIESQTPNDSHPQNSRIAMVTSTTTEVTITTPIDPSISTTAIISSQGITTTLPSSLPGEVVITYAAAAASAAATAINTTASTPTSYSNHRHHHHSYNRAGGNDIGAIGGHHHRYHHINEGSRRTFVREGEGSSVDGEESTKSRNKTKHSIPPHAADLGKPVYVSSASCKSPHKRGI